MSAHVVESPSGERVLAAPGVRVARWHESFAGEFEPVPGTVVRTTAKYVVVDFDDHGERRVEARNLTPWSEARDS